MPKIFALQTQLQAVTDFLSSSEEDLLSKPCHDNPQDVFSNVQEPWFHHNQQQQTNFDLLLDYEEVTETFVFQTHQQVVTDVLGSFEDALPCKSYEDDPQNGIATCSESCYHKVRHCRTNFNPLLEPSCNNHTGNCAIIMEPSGEFCNELVP